VSYITISGLRMIWVS